MGRWTVSIEACKYNILSRYFPLEMLVRHLEVISCRFGISHCNEDRSWLLVAFSGREVTPAGCQLLFKGLESAWLAYLTSTIGCILPRTPSGSHRGTSSTYWRWCSSCFWKSSLDKSCFQVLSALLSDFASAPSKVPLSERRQFTVVCQVLSQPIYSLHFFLHNFFLQSSCTDIVIGI